MNKLSGSIFVSTAKGMENILVSELEDMGISDITPTIAGASCGGGPGTAYKICLWSRTANRVLMPLKEFDSETTDQLYEGVKQFNWSEHFDNDNTFAVDFNSSHSQITHSHYGALRVKDAIVDYFRDLTGDRPSIEKFQPDIRINLYLKNDRATMSLDLSGESLHRRGYRENSGPAPLKENLAAAILLKSGWVETARSGGGLIDPMCGSGTFIIEAAMIAGDLAPGMLRKHFGFLKWKQYQPEIWENLLEDAEKREQVGLENIPTIIGYDASSRAIANAHANLERSGLHSFVHFEKRELPECSPHPKMRGLPGLMVLNPPYGERLGEVNELIPLYTSLGALFKSRFVGWKSAVFTGNPDLGKSMGLRAWKINSMYNGALPCKLLQFDVRKENFVEREHSIFQKTTHLPAAKKISPEAEMFRNRLKKNHRKLKNWLKKEKIKCYRLYDQDLPEYAVAIDIYDQWVHVQEYAPPKTIDPVKAKTRLKDIMAVIPEFLNIPRERVYLKVREKQKGSRQYEKLDAHKEFYIVDEGGHRFYTNFTDYLDTGLFLDHRITRKKIENMARGKNFLNLFAYTASASVYAARGGAKTTTSVDASKAYLGWARKNFALNGLGYEKHYFHQADCLEWMKLEKKRKYDLIFLDPPTFSNSKKMQDSFEIQRDHVELIRLATELLSPGGILIFSNNFRRFKIDFGQLKELEISDISRATIPLDFSRNLKIHNCWQITKR
ncbi:MAG: bifunctional 23S rRNA (guanine(2069)-N(7))-methyltransferase RlmK/23S rRNA (guanine(2445)-N(2))-methyltransferase RlmL [Proteobacteria bacterium]|nr:bifunctional 23S rRNA (guanine(2069)-N(7))-methyltransferase RlmK/23S rRNA (guanine(2445)-N(2))-methyltransferase RlmL [Pseudomonadota bacterium]